MTRPHRSTTLGLAIVAALTPAILPLAFAHQAEPRDEAWAREDRSLLLEHDAQGFRFESRRDAHAGETRLQGRFALESGELVLDFVSTEPDNATVLRWSLAVVALHEFADADGDGAYGPGDDAVQRRPLGNVSNPTLQVLPLIPKGWVVTARYPVNTSREGGDGLPLAQPELAGGALILRFWLAPSPQLVGGLLVVPTQVRLEAAIEDFPYETEDSGVALEWRASTDARIEGGGRELRAAEGYFEAYFAWDEWAQVGGATQRPAVTVSGASPAASEADGDERTVLFSYAPRGDVRQGAGTGVDRLSGLSLAAPEPLALRGQSLTFGLGALATAILVGTTAAVRMRRGS